MFPRSQERPRKEEKMAKYLFEAVALDNQEEYFYYLGYKDVEADSLEEAIGLYNRRRRIPYEFKLFEAGESVCIEGIGGSCWAHDAIAGKTDPVKGDEIYICVSLAG